MSEAGARNNIHVSVEVMHSPAHSEPDRLFYIYFITIRNQGCNRVQLLRRNWVIRAANGDRQEIDAQGVIGQTPIFEPGEVFNYNSGVPIVSAPGNMSGFYTFRDLETGELFTALVPPFDLLEPEHQAVPETMSAPERVMN